MSIYIPLASSIVSLIFMLFVLDQYFARRKPYQLVWAIGLLMYFISTGTEFWTGQWGMNLTVYRLWYLFGAIGVAAYLGMGTIYLLVKRRTAHIIMGILLAASVYAVVRVFTADIDITSLSVLSGIAMPQSIRMMTPIFNAFGTVALAGGALYSAWIFWRKRIFPHRAIGNVLIAVGAILPAVGGTHIRLGGDMTTFYVLELLGIVLIFGGFLRMKEVFGIYRIPLIHGLKQVAQ
jgi:hypothetical protein